MNMRKNAGYLAVMLLLLSACSVSGRTILHPITNNVTNNYTGNPFDQSLNTTDNVTFLNVTTTGNLFVTGEILGGVGTVELGDTLDMGGNPILDSGTIYPAKPTDDLGQTLDPWRDLWISGFICIDGSCISSWDNVTSNATGGNPFDQSLNTTDTPTFNGTTFTARVEQTGLGFSTFFGDDAGLNDDGTNNYNTAFGYHAIRNGNGGTYNVGVGTYANRVVTTGGTRNIAIGYASLYNNQAGDDNVGVGHVTLINLNGGLSNTAIGAYAARSLTSGNYNVAIGGSVLRYATTSNYNTAIGAEALYNVLGGNNMGIGARALHSADNVVFNMVLGTNAMDNLNGSYNTGVGSDVYDDATEGDYNTIIGYNTGAGITQGYDNTIIGSRVSSLTGSVNNTVALADGTGDIRYLSDSAGNATLYGDANITGSLIANIPHVEVWNVTENGYTVSIPSLNTWYNFTGILAGETQDFTIDGGLIPDYDGVYKVDWSVSFSGTGGSTHAVTLLINGAEHVPCRSYRKLGTAGDVGNMGGTCILTASAGDNITGAVSDISAPAQDIAVWSMNANILRVG